MCTVSSHTAAGREIEQRTIYWQVAKPRESISITAMTRRPILAVISLALGFAATSGARELPAVAYEQ
ncbi:MAG: hypothetical protein GWO24_03975, partial [Akkermansiaceae bacterium]|nr:hypothetical protein [Akkermansiaceae bacterium]